MKPSLKLKRSVLRVLADRLENSDEARTAALQISFAAL